LVAAIDAAVVPWDDLVRHIDRRYVMTSAVRLTTRAMPYDHRRLVEMRGWLKRLLHTEEGEDAARALARLLDTDRRVSMMAHVARGDGTDAEIARRLGVHRSTVGRARTRLIELEQSWRATLEASDAPAPDW
jgi:DNA-directed RNA polymerase specialized sigma24 family protein